MSAKDTITCGEATIRLLAKYGVDTLFGIPGVHTLDFCRGLGDDATIRHIQTRNEQGAGLMADGYARTSGKPGVALVISGPGVTNAATALGQAYNDSIPVLLISADADSSSLGKGWGVLHEVADLNAVTRPLTALSACARRPSDVPELIGQAFSIFASERPRPVHISIPIDVLSEHVVDDWQAVALPTKAQPLKSAIEDAAKLLKTAERPVILLGGGATDCADSMTQLAERLGAIVVTSCSGKGIVPDRHPLSLSATTVRPEVQELLGTADVTLAIGTEISETDSFVERLDLGGKLIRIDLDPRKMNDFYPADIPIVGDAKTATDLLLTALREGQGTSGAEAIVAGIKTAISNNLSLSEQQHVKLLNGLREALPDNAIMMGDACQVAYTGAFAMPVSHPRLWHYAAGYCTLGPALPDAIGAKIAQPDKPVVALAGDGGFMFTMQELVTAAELGIALPIIIWENGGLKQIQDDMRAGNVPRVGVDGINPDFPLLAKAMHCSSAEPRSMKEFQESLAVALAANQPTLIIVHENDDWLL